MPINQHVYSPEWNDVIRPAALRRAGYKCEVCGVSNKSRIIRLANDGWLEADDTVTHWAQREGVKIIRIVLTVSHINHIPTDNRPENLRVLCQLHHLQADSKQKKQMAFYSKIVDVRVLLSHCQRGDVGPLLPQLLKVYRAKRREMLQIGGIYDRYNADGVETAYMRVIKKRVLQLRRDCIEIAAVVVSYVVEEYNLSNAHEFARLFLYREDRIIGGKESGLCASLPVSKVLNSGVHQKVVR